MDSVRKFNKNQSYLDHLTKKRLEKKKLKAEKKKNKPKSQRIKGYKFKWKQKISYPRFLRSRYWKRVRKEVLKRDNNKCIICGSKKYLQVHHNTYKHHYREHLHLEDLDTLCNSCHKEFHATVFDFIQERMQ